MIENPKILFISAVPRDKGNLHLFDEEKVIEAEVTSSEYSFLSKRQVRVSELIDILDQHTEVGNIKVIHFCGHGGTDGLKLLDDKEKAQIVTFDSFANVFNSYKGKIECVIISACNSMSLAKNIVGKVDYAIGMQNEVSDKSCIAFAKGFYSSLKNGKTIHDAYEHGKLRVEVEVPDEKKSPVIFYGNIFDKVNKIIVDSIYQIDTEIAQLTNSPSQEILTKLKGKFQSCNKKLHDKIFQVAVVALAKSGKSSLLNSWLGKEFLPISDVPETMHFVRINHDVNCAQGFLFHDLQKIEGVFAINNYLGELNNKIRSSNGYNFKNDLILKAPLYALRHSPLNEYQFEILDTPGFNEAGVDFLKPIVEDMLDSADVIIYLLDYKKLKGTDEKQLFDKLKIMRNTLVNSFSNRLFFVVNKYDDLDRNSMPESETIEYVANLLKLQMPEMIFDKNNIILISAKYGLLARLIESNEATPEQVEDFAKVVFGVFYEKGSKNIQDCQPFAKELLKTSRIPKLESKILNHIYKNSKNIFYLSILDELDRNLKMMSNHFTTILGALKTDQSKLINRIESLQNKFNKITCEMNEIKSEISNFKKKIQENIDIIFRQFNKQNDKIIIESFKDGESVEECTTLNEKIHDTIKVIKKLNFQLWKERYQVHLVNRDEVEKSLSNLSEKIFELLNLNFQYLEQDIHDSLYYLQLQLIHYLENKAKPLARQIEEEVGKTFNISLQPINFSVSLPTRQDFLDKLKTDINTIIKTERSYSLGFFKIWLFGFIPIPCPKIDTTITGYSASSEDFIKNIKKQVVQMVDNCRGVVDELIDNKVKLSFDVVFNELETYKENYLSILNGEINSGKRKDVERQERLSHILNSIDNINSINDYLSSCQISLK